MDLRKFILISPKELFREKTQRHQQKIHKALTQCHQLLQGLKQAEIKTATKTLVQTPSPTNHNKDRFYSVISGGAKVMVLLTVLVALLTLVILIRCMFTRL